MYIMENDPNIEQCDDTINDIKKRLCENPDQNFFIIYVLKGRGMMSNGQQVVLLNEYCKTTNFYKIWYVEASIRDIALSFPNAYQLALFACSREALNRTDIHFGGFSTEVAQCLLQQQS